LRVYLEFESVIPKIVIEIGGKTYEGEDHRKLHGYSFPVHRYFDPSKEQVTIGRFVWSDEIDALLARMWIRSDEVDFFEKQLMTGEFYPKNVRLVTNTVKDEDVKRAVDREQVYE